MLFTVIIIMYSKNPSSTVNRSQLHEVCVLVHTEQLGISLLFMRTNPRKGREILTPQGFRAHIFFRQILSKFAIQDFDFCQNH